MLPYALVAPPTYVAVHLRGYYNAPLPLLRVHSFGVVLEPR
jgi:hypothetical protein